MDILGLGMSLTDTVQLVDEFPSGSGVTEVRESALMGGGPVPTALCAASRRGAQTAIIDRVGDDWRGKLIADDYELFGVDCRFLTQESERSSSLGIVLVRKRDGERHVVFQSGNATPITDAELPHEALRSCRILHLNGRHWPACLRAAEEVKCAGGLVSFDGGANRYEAKFDELFPLIDILIVARDFAEKCSQSDDRAEQLARLSGEGAAVVGITDGENGSWFRAKNGDSFHQDAFAVDPLIDTTGCGDVFHGAFLYGMGEGKDWEECAQIASAAAALNAQALGGRGNLPTCRDLASLLGRNL